MTITTNEVTFANLVNHDAELDANALGLSAQFGALIEANEVNGFDLI